MKTKLFIISYSLLALGVICLIMENIFYQYIDTNGFLHESFFMPLGILFIGLGAVGIITFIVKNILGQKIK